jgi:hypothetical protein
VEYLDETDPIRQKRALAGFRSSVVQVIRAIRPLLHDDVGQEIGQKDVHELLPPLQLIENGVDDDDQFGRHVVSPFCCGVSVMYHTTRVVLGLLPSTKRMVCLLVSWSRSTLNIHLITIISINRASISRIFTR